MKRIGLITTSHAINYGAVLQAFSLKKAIEENTCSKVDIINYGGDEKVFGRKLYRENTCIKDVLINSLCFMKIKYKRNRKKLISLFDDFKIEYLGINENLIKSEEELKKIDAYDTYVCGSDQVWNVKLFNDDVFFLSFVKDKYRKVAFAVSISDHLSIEEKQSIVSKVKDFKAISIREKEDAEELALLLNRKVENIMDPVFLHSRLQWENLLQIKNNNECEAYIFVFFISHSKTDQRIVNKIRKNRKVKVLNLHPIEYIKGDEILRVCSPQEFVKLIRNSTAVITDSFHCTAFSIIFNKEFYNIKRATRNNRIENLYYKLGIDSRFINEDGIALKEIEYERVNKLIENEAKLGIDYIVKNIGAE